MQRIFMIGWDGATFDLIRPWVAAGKLPNIARLMQEGVHGPLRSTIPPWTFPAWNSFMTGKNPGKHGIFDFFRTKPGSYALEFTNGGHRRAKTFWQILSEAGRDVVSISVPCTFPPEPVKGVMISGFDVPGGGPGSYVDSRGMYPPALFDELTEKVGRHPLDASIMKEINQGRPDLVLDKICEVIGRKAATAKYLMQNKPWDCFMILFGESDGSGHQFWKYTDPKSPLFTDNPPGMRDSILRVYQALDKQLGELIALTPADTTILMMSDHGFGGVSNQVIYPNCWLQKTGFLHFRGGIRQRMSRALDAFKFWAICNLSPKVKRFLYRLGRAGLGRFESGVRYAMINWAGTEAFFDENPYFPVLHINLKGRQPNGIVEPGKPYEEVRDRLIRELEGWRHPQTGEPIVEKAYRREEVYSGPCVELAADIIPKWALHQGYNYAFKLSSKSFKGEWIEQVDPLRADNVQFFSSKSGSHRDYGIFLGKGPTLRQGFEVDKARIIDLAPTILHLLGVPVPEDMDGAVLQEIFTESFAREFTVQKAAGPSPDEGAYSDNAYSSEDEEKISERLKALGYME
jgi:predicted AlkP superfamily phosphohydrolase/phosphomutase